MQRSRPRARVAFWFLAAIVPVPLTAAQEAPATFDEARSALRSGEYEAAAEGFRLLAAAEPGSTRAVRGWSKALIARGEHEEALRVLEAAPDLKTSPLLLAALGRLSLRRGALDAALKAFDAALAIDRNHVESLNRRGEVLALRGRSDEARASWERIVEIYRDMTYEEAVAAPADDFVEMGLALVGLNRYREANDIMFQQAEEKDAANPGLLLALGRVFQEKYNYPDSRDALKDLLEANPRSADALVALAANYLVDFQVGTKRYDLAEGYLQDALAVNPRHAGAYLSRGALWLTDGNVARAREDLLRSLELDSSSLRARGLLASCHYLNGDAAALAALEKETLAQNPRAAEFFHTIAVAIESKFRYQDVVKYCDRAVEVDPEYWPAYVTLGINCLRTGDEERGRRFIEKSWENDKFNPWVLNTKKLLAHMDDHHRLLVTRSFAFKLPKADYNVLSTYLAPLLEEAFAKLTKRYKVDLPTPIFIEVFSNHKWFSARTVGLGGFAASGACFGNLVTLTTPAALPQNWGAVAWHEFAHVITLALTEHRVPRWLTEGLSVLEEGSENPRWARPFEREIADAYGSGRLLPLAELDFGFSKPKYPNQILISYYQGCLIAQYIVKNWGFDAVLAVLKGYRDNKSTAEIFTGVLRQSPDEFDKGFFAHVGRWVEENGYEPQLGREVIPGLELAVEGRPADAGLRARLAWAYWCTGNDLDAVLTANKALASDPDNGDAHAVLGLTAYRYEKNPTKAKASLEKALLLETRFGFRAQAALGAIALSGADKNDEAAAAHFERAKAISPRAGAGQGPEGIYYQLLEIYRRLGKEELAIQQMEELSRFAVEDGKCRRLVAEYYLAEASKNDDDEVASRKALRYLEELVYIQPFDRKLHELLARLGARLEEHDVTLRAYKYLLTFPDTNPKIAYRALAKAHAGKGNAKEAVSFARKLLELDADDEDARAVLEKFGEE